MQSLATPAAPVSLDDRTSLSAVQRVGLVVVAGGVSALAVTACRFSAVQLTAIPSFTLAHSLISAVLGLVAAGLLLSHAHATRSRALLWPGATLLYLAVTLAARPLAFPGALVADAQLLGTTQSATPLAYAPMLALPVGLGVGAWLRARDLRTFRRPRLARHAVAVAVTLALLAAAVTVLLALLSPAQLMPALADPDHAVTELGHQISAIAFGLNLAFLVVALASARDGSFIGRWLVATALAATAISTIQVSTVARYTVGWYAHRLLWLAALSVLVVVLIRALARVDRDNAHRGAVDQLTGTDSRTAFVAAVRREAARGARVNEPVAILVLDLDGFNVVNDRLGHESGDAVLRMIVARWREHLSGAARIGRMAGDEFAILLGEDLTRTGDGDVAERIERLCAGLVAATARPIPVRAAALRVTTALGWAVGPHDGLGADELLAHAGLAMAAAKRAGGDRAHRYTSALGEQARQRARLRQQLDDAVRSGRFRYHYQPIHDRERIAGAEALLRWRRPDGEWLAAEFVPLAEETGQIVAIAGVALGTLAADLPKLLAHFGDGFFVTLNLGARELADDDLVGHLVHGPLAAHAGHLIVEITESLQIDDPAAVTNLDRLRAAGLRLAVDDFGTGFSNLSRLARLRPSLLKIDRSLVQQVTHGDGVAMLRAAIGVATAVRCDIVAEGVETQAQAHAVASLGVRLVQGFWFAAPAPVDTLLAVPARA